MEKRDRSRERRAQPPKSLHAVKFIRNVDVSFDENVSLPSLSLLLAPHFFLFILFFHFDLLEFTELLDECGRDLPTSGSITF